MSGERLMPDIEALRGLPPTTVRLARGLLVLLLAGVGVTFVLAAPDVGQRAAIAAATAVAVVAAVVLTWRRGGGRVAADVPAVRTAIAAIVIASTFAVLVAGVGPSARVGALLLGVVAVTGVFVLRSPQREVLGAGAVLAWVGALLVTGTDDPVVLATHASGALLLVLSAGRTAVVAEQAVTAEAAAAEAAGERAALVAAVLRMQSLEPEVVEQALLEGAQQLGAGEPTLHRIGEDGAPTDPAATDAAVATEVVRRGGPHVGRSDGSAAEVVGLPVGRDGTVLAVLTVRSSHPRHRGVTSARHDGLTLLVDEGGAALQRAHRYVAEAATVEELRRLEARTQDFVSTVSHELRTPVTVIEGLGQTIARRWDDLSPEKRDDLLGRIDANADRLSTMVRSLMDSSALERGELTAHRQPLALDELVGDVVARLASVTGARTVRVEVPVGLEVEADPGLLRHVVENLVTNAARHTPQTTTIEIVARQVDGEVELEVRDDGPGIPPDDLPHVLERFYRADPAVTTRPGGLGLGLALVRQIVELHGRQLTVRNRPEGGAVFRFALPSPSAPEAADPSS